jgi:aryl-alcohol dehydrogenase-like predicted oxidoreductase
LTPEEETLRALDDLVSQRLVRYIGCSNWPAWQITKALGISAHHGWAKFDTVQAYYSIAGRDLEREIVPMMADQKVGLLVWSPLAGGLLSGKFDAKAKPPEGRRTQMDFPIVDKERA